MITSVDHATRNRVLAWRIADYLDESLLAASLVSAIIPVCFLCFWLYGRIMSPLVSLYQANETAANEFSTVVDAEWFFNRPMVAEKLERMTLAYIATGENDPAKLGELRRLAVWTSAATSVADEQQYLSEVRSHGKVVMKEPFYAISVAILGSLLLWMLSFYGLYFLWRRLCIFSGRPMKT